MPPASMVSTGCSWAGVVASRWRHAEYCPGSAEIYPVTAIDASECPARSRVRLARPFRERVLRQAGLDNHSSAEAARPARGRDLNCP